MPSVPVIVTASVLLLALVAVLWWSTRSPKDPFILKLGPSFFFWLSLAYLVVLLVLAVAYQQKAWRLNELFPPLIGHILPVGVPWFGALGAVVISLQGVFYYNHNWQSRYNYWHIARPIFGAVLGIVAFFFLVLLNSASGTPPPFLGETSPAPKASVAKAKAKEGAAKGKEKAAKGKDAATGKVAATDGEEETATSGAEETEGDDAANNGEAARVRTAFIVYYVLAFLVGYREETFRELIKRVTDMILRPADGAIVPAPVVEARIGTDKKPKIEFPDVRANESSAPLKVQIVNVGDGPLKKPSAVVESIPEGIFLLKEDAVTGPDDLAPGAPREIELVFAPKEANKSYEGNLVIKGDNLSATKIPLSGKGIA